MIVCFVDHNIARIAAALAKPVSWARAARQAVDTTWTTYLCSIGISGLGACCYTVQTVLDVFASIALIALLHTHIHRFYQYARK